MTKISVAIPVFRPRSFQLEQALDSVYAQHGPFELEVIVCDDASGIDGTALKTRFPGLRFLQNAHTLGMVENWNHCVNLCHGELVLLLGQDDRLAPGMFAAYLNEFSSDPAVVLCACARRFIDAQGRVIRPRRRVNDRARIFVRQARYRLQHGDVLKLCLRNGNAIGEPSCVMYRRPLLEKLGAYDPEFRHAADLDFNLRISKLGDIVYLNEPYLHRRLHSGQITNQNRTAGHIGADRLRIYRRYSDALPQHDRLEARAYLSACAMKDLTTSILQLNGSLALRALRIIRDYGRIPPKVYARYLAEIVSGHNRNAM